MESAHGMASIMEEMCKGKIVETEVVEVGQEKLSRFQEVNNAICPGQCSGHGICNHQGKCDCDQGNKETSFSKSILYHYL